MANRHFAIAVAAIALVIGLVHAGSLGNGFHYDDGHSVVRNPHIRTLDLPRFLLDSRTFSERPEDAMYRPLVVSSLAFNFLLGGPLSVGLPPVQPCGTLPYDHPCLRLAEGNGVVEAGLSWGEPPFWPPSGPDGGHQLR